MSSFQQWGRGRSALKRARVMPERAGWSKLSMMPIPKRRLQGHIVLAAQLLRCERGEHVEIGPGPFMALLATSGNAAPAIARHERFAQLRALPVFAVGDRSAEAMRAVGFADVTSAQGDV